MLHKVTSWNFTYCAFSSPLNCDLCAGPKAPDSTRDDKNDDTFEMDDTMKDSDHSTSEAEDKINEIDQDHEQTSHNEGNDASLLID